MTTYSASTHKGDLESRIADIGVEIKRLNQSTAWATKKQLYDELAALRAELNELEVDQGDTTFEVVNEGIT